MASNTYKQPSLNIPNKYRYESNSSLPTQNTLGHQPNLFFKNKALLQLLDSAFQKNSDLLIAMQNIALTEKNLSTVKLNYLPELQSQITGNKTKASKNSLEGLSVENLASNNFSFSAILSWDIDIWKKLQNEKKEALADYLRTNEACKVVQTRLVSDVAKGYYNLLMLDKQLNIAKRSKELSDSTLQIMKIQYRVGDANILGVKQVEAQLEENKILISQIQQSISTQESALNVLCGKYASTISRQWDEIDEFYSIPAEGYPASMLANRSDIKAAELSLQAANARVGIQQVAMYPSINISISGGLNSLTTSNWFSIPSSLFGTITGGITHPIFNRKRLRMLYEQALIEREKEVVTFRQAVLVGFAQVSDALKTKEEVEKQFIFALNREKALRYNISAIQVLYTMGAANYLDIITVQSSYLEASLETARLSNERLIATIDLYIALGGGWK
jgi:NodT family efflux transporter outer membrane factor (OMF) lipoprotein